MGFRNIQKGIMTSIAGIAMIGVLVHLYATTGEFSAQDMVIGLGGLGLLFAKDQGASHTKK